MSESSVPKIVLIGWDAADWKIADPLLAAGKMPNLQRLIATGARGNLTTLSPALSPMLWTSIATGKRPFRHGVLGFTEPDPRTPCGVRPVSARSRSTRALWNILQLAGIRSNVTAWWPSFPAEPISGCMVAGEFLDPPLPGQTAWPAPTGSVHPARLTPSLRELRLHPEELDESVLQMFIPQLRQLDPSHPLLSKLAAALAQAASVQAAATSLMQLEPAGLNAVYFNAIDQICHNFIRFYPPKPEWVSGADFALFSGVVEAAYRFHDLMLGYVMHLAGPDSVVILVSDHGFHCDHRRVPDTSGIGGPEVEHRRQGMLVMSGPGIRAGETIRGASILDVTPTILHLLNLPVGNDMDGVPILSALTDSTPRKTIPSWDQLEGEDGSLPPEETDSLQDSSAGMDRLIALGYIAAPTGEARRDYEVCLKEREYNLALAWLDASCPVNAAAILSPLVERHPEENRFRFTLVQTLQALGRTQEAAVLIDQTAADQQRSATANPEETTAGRSRPAFNPALADYLRSGQLLSAGRPQEALAPLHNALQKSPGSSLLLGRLGVVLLRLQDYPAAMAAFRKVLAIEPDNINALLGMARCMLVQRNPGQALHYALDAIELQHLTADAHFLLAISLIRLRRPIEATEALKMTIAINPVHVPALKRLATLVENRLHDHEYAERLRSQAEEAIQETRNRAAASPSPEKLRPVRRFAVAGSRPALEQDPELPRTLTRPLSESIVVVSGLPRSGTSMMMQVLQAGGVPIVADEFRPADENNIAGYQEDQRVTRLHLDNSWIPSIQGSAVKIIAPLVRHLPLLPQLNYGVILMLRDIPEILKSQQEMLARLGRVPDSLASEQIAAAWREQISTLRRLLATRNIPVLPLEYKYCLLDPQATAEKIRWFLNTPLNTVAMALAIQPNLTRQTRLKTAAGG
jgi:predicted AlkP superfamily phosphohydrolase/phosphomutase/tetratricopeptide (TPR) repeat protein